MNVWLTVTLFWYNPRLLCYGNCPWKILVSIRITWFTKLNRKVCIKTTSTPASLPSTIVKWPIRAFLSNNTRRIARCYLLWRPDFTPFNKVTISKLSLENHLKPFSHTSDNISKRLYIYFFGRANSNLNSLARSLDSEVSEIQLWPSGLCFYFYPAYQQFLKPKILLALKVLQAFPGKIIAWKRKSTVVNVYL